MALQETNDANRAGQHHCRDCGVFFESGKSLEVHLQYHKENLLSKWANQAANQASHNAGDTENNNVKRREFQTAPADSTVLPTGPGRPSSTTGYTGSSSPYPHPQTPQSYTSAPSPYQSDVPSNPGPSPSSTSYGYSNGEAYSVPYNGYARPPRPQPGYYSEQPPQEGYSLPPAADTTPHSPSSSSSFRFFNKPCYPLDKNGVSSSSPNTCEKCGCVCESQVALSDHIKAAHPSYGHISAFQAPDSFYKTEPTHDSPDILDLDCQQKFRPSDEESGSLPPVSNPHSVTAMLNPWPQSKYPPYHVTSSNPPPQSFQNGVNYPPESYPPSNVPNTPAIPNATSPKPAPQNSGKGDSWKSNEARRPKTYNCSACNKWFTSSGHLKRHYNTTLHKNAVKQSGHPDPATLPISSHHHPDRDPNYIHSSKTPPGVPNPPPNVGSKPKKAKSMSPQGNMGAVSPALSSANEGDSSRSGFNTFDLQPQSAPPPQQPSYDNGFAPPPESFDYYRYENRLPQNSTNQVATQPPNYQAGLSVSPSGDLPICPPSLHSLPTLNHLTYMGENITTQVESVQQLQALGQHTTPLYTNSLIITGNQSEPLPSFSQLLPEAPFSKSFYAPSSTCQEYYMKTTSVLGDDILMFKSEPTEEEFAIKTEPEDMLGSYEDMDGMLSETSPNPSPVQFPTSTNVEPDSQGSKPTKKKKKKKKEESSNHVSSTCSPNPVIRCEECDKSFNRICYLTQHNKCFHSGVKPFKCERCGKRFHSELRARDHERKHGGVKPYRCEVCPKSFNHKTDLRRHLCLHSGQKPFACGTCGKGFIRKDHMLKHMDTHKNTRKRYMPADYGEEDDKARVRLLVQNEMK